jgi:HD-GYP domain-containing protein (c-di-GMP phosphodiesterase class II)
MRLIPISRAVVGSELGRDVLVGRPDGVPLLRAGVRLTARYRDRLAAVGVMAVYVEDEASEGIIPEPVVSDETRALATRAVSGAFDSVQESFTSGKPIPARAMEALADVVRRMILEIDSSAGVALALADLSNADAYTFQHSIDVAALGLLVGQRFFRDYGWIDYRKMRRFTDIDERLSNLGIGLLLHDIGKLVIPQSVLHKPGKLTEEEWVLIKSHPRAGVDMLQGTSWSPLVKAIVLRHHERWNGSGYPDGKAGTDIHQMARIAAVADVYDAITSTRSYAPARPAHVGVQAILDGSGTLFDPEVVDAFRKVVAPFPAGSEVEFVDGRRGVVVSVSDKALERPLVRVLDGPGAPCEVSLDRDPSIQIVGWNDQPAAAAA